MNGKFIRAEQAMQDTISSKARETTLSNSRELPRLVLFNGISVALSAIISVLTAIIFARSVSTDHYGNYITLLAAVQAIASIGALGIPFTLAKVVSERDARQASTTRNIEEVIARLVKPYALLCAFCGLLVACLPLIGFYPLFRADILLVFAGSVTCVGLMVFNFLSAIFIGLRRFEYLTAVNTALGLVTLGSGIAGLAMFGHSAFVLVISHLIGILSGILITYAFLSRLIAFPHPPPIGRADIKPLYRFAASVAVITLIDTIVWGRSEIFFLGYFQGSQEAAYYGVAYGLSTIITTAAVTWLANALMPIMSHMNGAGELERAKSLYRKSSRYLTIIVLPFVIGGGLLAHPLVETVFGARYSTAADPLFLLLIATGIGAIARPGSSLLYSTGGTRFMAQAGMVFALINIVLDLILIQAFGLIGAALASSTIRLCSALSGALYIKSRMSVCFPTESLVRCSLSAIAMTPLLILSGSNRSTSIIGLLPIIGLAVLIYLLFLVITREISPADLRGMRRVTLTAWNYYTRRGNG